jgi:hypothetical protein
MNRVIMVTGVGAQQRAVRTVLPNRLLHGCRLHQLRRTFALSAVRWDAAIRGAREVVRASSERSTRGISLARTAVLLSATQSWRRSSRWVAAWQVQGGQATDDGAERSVQAVRGRGLAVVGGLAGHHTRQGGDTKEGALSPDTPDVGLDSRKGASATRLSSPTCVHCVCVNSASAQHVTRGLNGSSATRGMADQHNAVRRA